MRWGLIARCDDRGIGNQTWEVYRHLHPDRTLVIREPNAERRGFTPHFERYPDADILTFDGSLDEQTCRRFLDGLDVVYSVETVYDWAFVGWARSMGVRTIIHLNPEFHDMRLPSPDRWWIPTTWRASMLPHAVVVPVPVATDRIPAVARSGASFLHVVGDWAVCDRAGTDLVLAALAQVSQPLRMVMVTQNESLQAEVAAIARTTPWPVGGVDLEVRTRSRIDYWQLYEDADVLVSPRRYGGLSLPHNEAAAAGCALVLSDCAPNPDTWPGWHLPGYMNGGFVTSAGHIPTFDTDVAALARALDRLASTPADVELLSGWSRTWAAANSWDQLGPLYLKEMEQVCS